MPGPYAESSTGRIFPRFYIRGLGNIDFYLGASQPVEIIQDDVVEEHVVLKSNPAFDVAQVEVLKGPQDSLFGRNTTAGIIKFDTVQPSETWAGQGSVSYGRFNSVNADAGVGGPLTRDGSVGFRLSGLFQHRDNWISNTYAGPSDDGTVGGHNVLDGFDERDIRLQVLAKPTSALSIRLSGNYRDYAGFASIFDRGRSPNDEAQNNPQAYKTHGTSLKGNAMVDRGFRVVCVRTPAFVLALSSEWALRSKCGGLMTEAKPRAWHPQRSKDHALDRVLRTPLVGGLEPHAWRPPFAHADGAGISEPQPTRRPRRVRSSGSATAGSRGSSRSTRPMRPRR